VAEEFRFFLRTGVYVAIAGAVYWIMSYEAAGTVLLGGLLLALLAFIVVGRALGRDSGAWPEGGALAWVDRVIGFAERPVERAPLEAGPLVVPTSSPWPVVTAAAIVVIGLGLIFGPWLIVLGTVVLLAGGVGWLTQMDEAE
jgi:hypothetical protein